MSRTKRKFNVKSVADKCNALTYLEKGLYKRAVSQKYGLIFLPPNITSVTQPMDQGVIKYLKVHYRECLVKLMLRSLAVTQSLPKVTFLRAVTKETFINCFSKGNISEKESHGINDEDDPFKELDENFNELGSKNSTLAPEGLTGAILASTDDDVVTKASMLTDKDSV